MPTKSDLFFFYPVTLQYDITGLKDCLGCWGVWGKLGRTVRDRQSHLTDGRLTHTLPAQILPPPFPPLCSPLLVRWVCAPAGPMWRCLRSAQGTQSSLPTLCHSPSTPHRVIKMAENGLRLLQQRLECLGRKRAQRRTLT